MIYYDFVQESPIGSVLLGATEKGLCAVILGKKSPRSKLAALGEMFPSLPLSNNRYHLRVYRRELEGYFFGKTKRFSNPIDLEAVTSSFQRRVLKTCRKIPYGRVISYRTLALRAGSPKGARAAGSALAMNPLPIVIPCHRVISSSGGLGGFGCGLTLKRKLLSHEGLPLGAHLLRSIVRV